LLRPCAGSASTSPSTAPPGSAGFVIECRAEEHCKSSSSSSASSSKQADPRKFNGLGAIRDDDGMTINDDPMTMGGGGIVTSNPLNGHRNDGGDGHDDELRLSSNLVFDEDAVWEELAARGGGEAMKGLSKAERRDRELRRKLRWRRSDAVAYPRS